MYGEPGAALPPPLRRLCGRGVFVSIAAAAVPGDAPLWARLHGTTAAAMTFGENAAGLAVLKARGQTFKEGVRVFLNGLGQSQLPYGGSTQTLRCSAGDAAPGSQDRRRRGARFR